MDTAKLFMLNNLSIESDLRKIQDSLEFDLGSSHKKKTAEPQEKYSPQFTRKIRSDAKRTALNYKIFYRLENSIRQLINDVLSDKIAKNWWMQAKVVPEQIKVNAESNKEKERATGITPRSDSMLDYTNFGELGQIIGSNWEYFDDILTNNKAVERIISNLNTLRAAIAHCTPLPEDEELRLHLSLRDWFRQQA